MKKVLIFMLLLCAVWLTNAQTPPTIIYVKSGGAGNMSGTSWENALPNINAALSAAPRYGANQIWVTAEVYNIDKTIVLIDGVSLYGGFAGNEPADYDLSQRDLSVNTTLSGGNRRVITQNHDFANPTVVDGFTIMNGRDNYAAGALIRGNTTLSHCIITNNSVYCSLPADNVFYGAAGGLHCEGAVVSHCVIRQNEIDFYQGNSMTRKSCAGGVASVYSTISNCLITDNTTNSNSCTGGMATSESHVVNCNIVQNNGAGAYLHNNQTFINCVVYDNNYEGNYGGSDISYLNGTDLLHCFSNCAIGKDNNSNIFGNETNLDLQSDNIGYSGYGGWHPNFTNPDSGDFTLRPMSVLIDGGTVEGIDIPEYDLNGNPRVQQHGIDIGCFEFTNDGTYGYDGIVYVKATASGDSSGTSWSNAMSDLQAAVNTANALGGNCKVWVAAGTYYGNKHGFTFYRLYDGMVESHTFCFPMGYANCFSMKEGVDVYGGFAGNEPLNYDISQRNLTANMTILDGENLRRVLCQPAPFETQTIWDGFCIQNGYDSLHSWIVNNFPYYYYEDFKKSSVLPGAGCYLMGNSSLSHCIIRNNRSSNEGGGIYAKNATLADCEIYNNKSHNNTYSYYSSDNSVGGGIYADSVFFVNCAIHNNSSYGYAGGAFCKSYVSFTNCNISNNTTNGYGGGVFLDYYLRFADFTNCNIVNNLSLLPDEAMRYAAGGLSCGDEDDYYMYDDFTNNGDYYIVDTSYHIRLTNCIIWGNRSLNHDLPQEIPANVTGYATLKNCAVEEGYDGVGNVTLSSANEGTGIVGPRFVQPTAGAGAAYTGGNWQLQSDSWLINRGDTTTSELPATDLAGNSRIQQGKVDIGCYESSYTDVSLPQFPDHIVYVKPNGSGDKSGVSWENAADDINYAVAMSALFDSMQVWVATGLYYGDTTSPSAFLMRENVNVYGGFAGNEPSNFALSLRNLASNPTILDGQHGRRVLRQPRHFEKHTEWDGFVMRNGKAVDNVHLGGGGGVLLTYNGSVNHCHIHNCENYGVSMFVGGDVSNSLICNNSGAINCIDYDYYDDNYNPINIQDYRLGGEECINSTIVANEGFGVAIKFKNCIIWGNGDMQYVPWIPSKFDHCAVEGIYRPGCVTLEPENDGTDFFYPRFISPTAGAGINFSGGDWRLQSSSDCINKGDTVGIEVVDIDLAGNSRVQLDFIDIGCYESSSYNEMMHPQYPDSIIYVTQTGAGTMDGTSWGNAMADINKAVRYAAAFPDVKVWVANGTYYGDTTDVTTETTSANAFYIRENANVYGGFAGNEPADYDLALRDFTTNATILDGQNSRRVLYQRTGFEFETEWNGFLIQNGKAESIAAGCVLGKKGVLRNCVVSNNTNTGYGAGGVCLGSGYISDCDINNNIANEGDENHVMVGGVYGSGNMLNCIISDNIGFYAGGAYVDGTLSNCEITNNTATSGDVYHWNAGGVYGSGNMLNCIISNNTGSYSGGFVWTSGSLTNCLINNNNSDYFGGGLVYAAYSPISMSNCNVVNNYGQGLYLSGDVKSNNCIVWGNRLNEQIANVSFGNGASETFRYCAVEQGDLGNTNISLSSDNEGSEGNCPRFIEPTAGVGTGFFGGNWQLQDSSVCINRGDTVGVAVTELDLSGNPRIQHGKIDIGCYESPYYSNDTITVVCDTVYKDIYGEFCKSFTWNDSTYTVTGNYIQNFKNTSGCDSIVTLHLTILSADTVITSDTICGGVRTVLVNASNQYLRENYYLYNNTSDTCRITYLYNNMIDDSDGITIIDVNGEFWDETYYDLVSTRTAQHEFDCDTTYIQHTIINFSDMAIAWDNGCGFYVWDGDTMTQAGTYERYFTNSSGCYSEGTLFLEMRPSVYETIIDTACESYALNGITYLESGIYAQNVDVDVVIQPDVIQYDEDYGVWVWYDDEWGTGWSESETVTVPGCKFITLHLTITHSVSEFVETTVCDSYTWNGITYTESGDYLQTLATETGCDSVVTLHLIVNHASAIDTTAVACDNFVWYGETYTTSGDYPLTLTNVAGCDSIVTLHLTVKKSSSSDTSAVVCGSFTWHGDTYTQSGDYPLTLTNSVGCDSIVTLHLTINPIPEVTITGNTTICPGGGTMLTATGADSYLWSNYSTNASIPVNMFGVYSVTGTTAAGCFNTATVTVLVADPPVITITGETDICSGETTTLTANGGVTYLWSNGSTDSVLTVNAVGSWQVIGYDENGCNGMVSVTVNLWQPATSSLYITSFDSCYTWFGTPYCQSGDYTHTLQTIHGCDSVITLHLTLEEAIITEFSATGCDSYTWNGITYSQSGNYTQNFTAANGSDSIVTLHLTLMTDYVPQIMANGTLSACGEGSVTLSVDSPFPEYLWSTGDITSSVTIGTAGYYWVTVGDGSGCTSVSEQVHIGVSELITETPSICMVGVENNHNLVVWEELNDPDVVGYQLYRENGQANVFEPLAFVSAGSTNAYEDTTADPAVRAYRYRITTVDTCGGETPMSEYHKTVHLTINQGLGNSYNLIWTPYEGFEFSSYKLYRGTANNNLQLIQTMPSTLTSFTDNNPTGDALFYQIEVVMNGSCVQNTRDITFTGARSNIVYNGTPVTTEVSVNACDSYDWNGQHLTSSGDYTQSFYSLLGYDSVVTLHLTVNNSVTSEFAISCPDSCYIWNDVDYCQSGDYTQTLQTVHGCDSVVTLHLTITVGLDDHNGFDFKVYPNPTNGVVNVQFTIYNVQLSGAEIHVVDMYGRLVDVVETQNFASLQTDAHGSSVQTQIDLSRYATGVYFIKAVADGKTVAVLKVVKQ